MTFSRFYFALGLGFDFHWQIIKRSRGFHSFDYWTSTQRQVSTPCLHNQSRLHIKSFDASHEHLPTIFCLVLLNLHNNKKFMKNFSSPPSDTWSATVIDWNHRLRSTPLREILRHRWAVNRVVENNFRIAAGHQKDYESFKASLFLSSNPLEEPTYTCKVVSLPYLRCHRRRTRCVLEGKWRRNTREIVNGVEKSSSGGKKFEPIKWKINKKIIFED